MNILLISCSQKGFLASEKLIIKLKDALNDKTKYNISLITKSKEDSGQYYDSRTLNEIMGAYFNKSNLIVFFGACGICVRMIAPFIADKKHDPAVVVVDDNEEYCISLLSGHMGGANFYTKLIASLIKSTPVITTATDSRSNFSVDEFARKNGLLVTNLNLAKEMSARVIKGEKITVFTEEVIEGMIPNGVAHISLEEYDEDMSTDLVLFVDRRANDVNNQLTLIPKDFCVGVGCKKDTNTAFIYAAVVETLDEYIESFYGISLSEEELLSLIEGVASIDIKQDESGIVEFLSKEYNKTKDIPFFTYSAKELSKLTGDFEQSDFVFKTTGVSNVCERSAVMLADKDYNNLVVKKVASNAVTVAISRKKRGISFE